jgi:anti-sigma-K factor RskA
MTQADLPDTEALIAEYALGLLSEDERQTLEDTLARSPDLQQDLVAWNEYLVTFTENLPTRAPAPTLLARIEAQAFGGKRKTLWQLVLPYLIGGVLGAGLLWVALQSGVLTQLN